MGNVGALIYGYFCLKKEELEVRGFDKTWSACDFDKQFSACQWDDGSCCEKISEFVMVTFSCNQTKR